MLNPNAAPFEHSLPPSPLPPCFFQLPPPSLPFPHPPCRYLSTYFIYPSPLPPSAPLLPAKLAEPFGVEAGARQGKAPVNRKGLNLVRNPADNNPPPPPSPLLASNASKGKRRSVWLPRPCRNDAGEEKTKRSSPSGFSGVSSSSMEFDRSHPETNHWTTVMIKNVPNKLSREMLIEMLDRHCVEENNKALIEDSPLSEYDFLYLPMDFRNRCNLGYAFVNFTTAAAAWRLYGALHLRRWSLFGSKKISHVCYARIQGKGALLQHFKQSFFWCDDEEYLPVVLSPPRNGAASRPSPAVVGSRISFRPPGNLAHHYC